MILSRACWTPFAGHVAGQGGRFALAGDLVDLVDVDDPLLGPLHIVIGSLQQAQDDVLHILAHVAGLGQVGGIGHGKGHLEDAGQGLGQQRLAGTGGPEQQDVALLHLHIARLLAGLDALVVVVDRDRQHLLGLVLADDVFVEDVLDLPGLGQFLHVRSQGLLNLQLFRDDIVAELDALVADVHRRSGDEFLDLFLAFAAERAGQVLLVCFPTTHAAPPSTVFLVTMASISPYSLASPADMK